MKKFTIASTTDPIEEIQFACGLTDKQPERTAYTVEQEIIREERQGEMCRAAENSFLNAATDQQEYRRRVAWLGTSAAVAQPTLAIDEMSMSDYNKMRDRQTGGRR